MDATTRFESQRAGALPVIVAYLEKMRLAAVIDENIPWEGEVPLGILVEIMVCNRLLNPKAQYKIGEWAKSAGVCDYYGVTAELHLPVEKRPSMSLLCVNAKTLTERTF